MEENKKNSDSGFDPSYGGCQYRLSYDEYQKKNGSPSDKKTVRPLRIFMIAFVVVIFFSVAYFIVRYYRFSVRKIFSENQSEIRSISAVFPAYEKTAEETTDV